MQDRFQFQPLGEQHRRLRAAFSCGVEELDRYFRQQAGQEMRRGVAVVWVLYDAEQDAIAGYYTLSAASLEPAGLPEEMAQKLPRYPTLPAMLVGRLAADAHYRGQGFGELLLFDALRRALQLSQSVGTIAVIVDAKDESVRRFYERYGFQRFGEHARRLFIPMGTIAQVIQRVLD